MRAFGRGGDALSRSACRVMEETVGGERRERRKRRMKEENDTVAEGDQTTKAIFIKPLDLSNVCPGNGKTERFQQQQFVGVPTLDSLEINTHPHEMSGFEGDGARSWSMLNFCVRCLIAIFLRIAKFVNAPGAKLRVGNKYLIGA